MASPNVNHVSLALNDATALASRLPHPNIGDVHFNKATGEVLYYYGTLLGWCPPWNSPWGEVASSVLPHGSFVNATPDWQQTDLQGNGMKTPFTAIQGRIYEVQLRAMVTLLGGVECLVEVVAAYFSEDTVSVTPGAWSDWLQRPLVQAYAYASATELLNSPQPIHVSRRFGPNDTKQIPVGPGAFYMGVTQAAGNSCYVSSDFRVDTALIVSDVGPSAAPVIH